MATPEIRIQYSWLLAGGPSKVLAEKYAATDSEEFSDDDYERWTAKYREEWRKYEHKILRAMCAVLGLEFYKPVVDVAVAPWFKPVSDPLILNFRTEPDQFVDVLTHELFHILLTDNQTLTIQNKPAGEVDLLGRWQKLFGEEHTFNALVHIPVHAGCKYIYLDVLGEESRLDRDIQESQQWPDYKAAWDYVQHNDYNKILATLKKNYKDYGAEIQTT